MYDITIDECKCICENAEITKIVTPGQIIFWSMVIFSLLIGVGYFLYWLYKQKKEKYDKYLEIKIGR